MLKDLERFSEDSGMEVNKDKTKVMVFRKEGGLGKEKWVYKNKELEIVNEYKYLDFWITGKNTYARQIEKMSAKLEWG